MSVRRLGVLLANELAHGSKGFLIVSVVMPLFMSLLVSLLFGSVFSPKPKLGIVDQGRSALVLQAQSLPSITVRTYAEVQELEGAVEAGRVDMGVVLPAGFDEALRSGERARLEALVWGESLAKNRLIVGAALAKAARQLAGEGARVQLETVSLGEAANVPWTDRLFPFIILITVFLGGIFMPATSLINEKEKKTLQAVLVTPTSAGEVFAAKGVVSAVVCILMGVFILVLNSAFGLHPWLLLMMIGLGTLMAVALGLMLGVVLKDVTTLFAFWKSAGIVLFGPTIVYMFPKIPQWIGRIFPTYYLLEPIMKISQRGGGWAEVSFDVTILVAIDVALLVLLALVLRGAQRRQALA